MPYSCLLVAGEKSGEDHALSFFPALTKEYPDFNFLVLEVTNLVSVA